MAVTSEPEQLPFPRSGPLELPPRYAELRERTPVVRVRTPTGDPAWLVLGYDAARLLFADPRLGRAHRDPPTASRLYGAAVNSGPSGDFDTEHADHARMRRLLVPSFSAKRMRLLAGRVEELVDACLDDLVAARDAAPDGVADLHAHLSFPLPVLVICELLGVPYADRALFRGLSERIGDTTGGDDAYRALGELVAYTGELAAAKRREPGEDVVSDLVAAQASDPTFDDAELSRLAMILLFAGHETTAVQIDLTVLEMLADRRRRDAFVAGLPGSVGPTVEEHLRTTVTGPFGVLRYAREDIAVAGVTIAAGDAVVLSLSAANRDPAAFADPDRFDPARRPNAHLGFGHGGHFCLGASLARTELTTTLRGLFTRLPGLRLAVDVADVRLRADQVTGGPAELPVTW